MPTNDSTIHKPEDLLKKEARGTGNAVLGEVKEVSEEYVITEKGIIDKDRFYIPKNLVERFDGDTVYFKITKEEAKEYKRD